jgi:hypothetical protein
MSGCLPPLPGDVTRALTLLRRVVRTRKGRPITIDYGISEALMIIVRFSAILVKYIFKNGNFYGISAQVNMIGNQGRGAVRWILLPVC